MSNPDRNNIGRILLLAAAFVAGNNPVNVSAQTPIGDVDWSADGNSSMRLEGDLRIFSMQDNVRVRQGTLSINGDEAVFEYSASSNELLKVTVVGTPVNYEQQAESGTVTGSSETIILYREETTQETVLEFLGDAVVNSADSSMHCQAIIYLADQELIREATGPCQGTLNSSNN